MGLSSLVNAVIFISINTKCRRQITRFSLDMAITLTESNKKRESRVTVTGRIDIPSNEVHEMANTFELNSGIAGMRYNHDIDK